MFAQIVLLAILGACIHGYPTGAPPFSCDSTAPFHDHEPQTEPFPYTIEVEKNQINSGDSIKVTIKGKGEEKFRGYLLTARSEGTRVGTFSALDDRSHTINCGSGDQGNAITQSDAGDKTEAIVNWTAPKNFKGKVVFDVTVVKVYQTYWVGQKSSPVIVV